MQARFRKSSKCGCTVEETVFLIALYYYWSQYVQRQSLERH